MIGEYNEQSNLIQSYGYEPGSWFTLSPVFTYRPDFAEEKGYSFFINDHLGTPQKLILRNGQKVWEAYSDVFGKTVITNNKFRNPLRFSGQYKDEESSLRYNFWRFYDSDLGRYITSDPIGLEGGLNSYAYAEQNPLINIDTEGKHAKKIIGSLYFIYRMVCSKDKKLCKELAQCIRDKKKCKRFCKVMRSDKLYHPFCDGKSCNTGKDKQVKKDDKTKGPTVPRQDSPASAQYKKLMLEICLNLRLFVKDVCFNNKPHKTHDDEIEKAKKRIKECEPLCYF